MWGLVHYSKCAVYVCLQQAQVRAFFVHYVQHHFPWLVLVLDSTTCNIERTMQQLNICLLYSSCTLLKQLVPIMFVHDYMGVRRSTLSRPDFSFFQRIEMCLPVLSGI